MRDFLRINKYLYHSNSDSHVYQLRHSSKMKNNCGIFVFNTRCSLKYSQILFAYQKHLHSILDMSSYKDETCAFLKFDERSI